MVLALIFQGFPESPLSPIARWEWVFPVVESIHMCGIGLLAGTILILDNIASLNFPSSFPLGSGRALS